MLETDSVFRLVQKPQEASKAVGQRYQRACVGWIQGVDTTLVLGSQGEQKLETTRILSDNESPVWNVVSKGALEKKLPGELR